MKTKAEWKLEEAREHLDEVIEEALEHGPQTIVLRGRKSVVVVDASKYQPAEDNPPAKPRRHLLDIILSSPHRDIELNLERRKDPPRLVDFGEDE